jgi:uncharacterized protein (TIGR03083 family)
MTTMAVDGYRAERDAVLELARSLSPEEWVAPSDCAGWAARDVLAHLASTIHGVVDPAYLPPMAELGPEAAMEVPVGERRSWSVADVIEEYETSSAQAAEAFAMLQEPPVSQTLLPMGALGTHPMAILPATFLFDSYCHLRWDLLAPHGPIERAEPPRDEQRLRPTLDWMLAGLPWMNADALAFLDRPVVLAFDGPGGRTVSVGPGGDEGRPLVEDGASDDAVATVRSTDHDFVCWGTQRRPWAGYVKVEGDEAYAGRVLDAINII